MHRFPAWLCAQHWMGWSETLARLWDVIVYDMIFLVAAVVVFSAFFAADLLRPFALVTVMICLGRCNRSFQSNKLPYVLVGPILPLTSRY